MLKIRLSRRGKKRQPSYRIIVANVTSKRDGRIVERIGHYNPLTDPPTFAIKEDRALHWLSVGAQPTDAVRRLLDKQGTTARLDRLHAGESVAVLAAEVTGEAVAAPEAVEEVVEAEETIEEEESAEEESVEVEVVDAVQEVATEAVETVSEAVEALVADESGDDEDAEDEVAEDEDAEDEDAEDEDAEDEEETA